MHISARQDTKLRRIFFSAAQITSDTWHRPDTIQFSQQPSLMAATTNSTLFTTTYLRDSINNATFAVLQHADTVKSVSYIIYERIGTDSVQSRVLEGTVHGAPRAAAPAPAPVQEGEAAPAPIVPAPAGPTVSFAITKGAKYFIVTSVTLNDGSSSTYQFERDPNKRRLVAGAASKKRAAAPATEAAAGAASAAPAASAAAPAAAEEPAKKAKAEKAADKTEKAPKKKNAGGAAAAPIAVA